MMMPPDDATTTLAPQEKRMTPPASSQSSSRHEIRMAQLQMELVHAMADRVEIEIKISIVRAQIMAEEELQAREIFHQQRSLHQQPLQQQLEEYNRVRRTLPVCSSLEQRGPPNEMISSYTTNSMTNGLIASSSVTVAAANMLPPIPFGKTTRRIPEAEEVVVVALPRRMQWSDQGKEEDSTIEDNTAAAVAAAAAAVAVKGWVCADNTSSSTGTSKRVVSSIDDTNKNNNDKEVSNKRRRVVESIDCLLTLVNHRRRAATTANNTIQSSLQQGPAATSISITNHSRMRPLTYAGRGIQW